jgi:D-glycero-D-manno-heptose 1,7-bisphosphate phosphatase
MLLDAARSLGLDLRNSIMVGDRWRDIEAGARAGCRTVFIDRGYLERRPVAPDKVTTDLSSAVDWILCRTPMQGGRHECSLPR